MHSYAVYAWRRRVLLRTLPTNETWGLGTCSSTASTPIESGIEKVGQLLTDGTDVDSRAWLMFETDISNSVVVATSLTIFESGRVEIGDGRNVYTTPASWINLEDDFWAAIVSSWLYLPSLWKAEVVAVLVRADRTFVTMFGFTIGIAEVPLFWSMKSLPG